MTPPIHEIPLSMGDETGPAGASVVPAATSNLKSSTNCPQCLKRHTDRQRRRDPVTRKEAMPPPRRRQGERPGSAGAAERGRESARRALHDVRGKGRARVGGLAEEGVTNDPDRGNHVPRSAESDHGSKVDCCVNTPH